jgi:aspartate/tyrosine/aromatic aminotransferase
MSALDYSQVSSVEPDSLFQLVAAFNACKEAKKVNLSIGAYRDENGNPKVLDVVRKVLNNSL